MNSINIIVAEKIVKIISSDENINIIKKKMKDFITSNKTEYKIYIESENKTNNVKVIRKNNVNLEIESGESMKTHGDKVVIKSDYIMGEIRQKEACFHIKQREYISLIIRNAIRECYMIWFLDEIIAMHGAGIIMKNKGYLFCGPPGEGKTTIARLSKSLVLNDEFIFLRKEHNEVYMYGTPFGGELQPKNQRIKLNKIFFIKKADKTTIEPLNKGDTFLKMVENNFLFFKIIVKREIFLIKNILKITKELSNIIKGFQLHFSIKDKISECIKE